MKKPSKNIFLSLALSLFAIVFTPALAQEAPLSLTSVKEIASNPSNKKQRLNKSLALNAVKRTTSLVPQRKKPSNRLFLIHSVLPNSRTSAE